MVIYVFLSKFCRNTRGCFLGGCVVARFFDSWKLESFNRTWILDYASVRYMQFFEEGDVILWRGWCGTLKRAMWYFEEGDVVFWRGYFHESVVVLWRGLCGTLKRALWYFEEGGVVLWRGWFDSFLGVFNPEQLYDRVFQMNNEIKSLFAHRNMQEQLKGTIY